MKEAMQQLDQDFAKLNASIANEVTNPVHAHISIHDFEVMMAGCRLLARRCEGDEGVLAREV